MPDLRTRFRGADRIPAPDLWDEIERREPRPTPQGLTVPRRVATAALALVLAAAATTFAVRALNGGRTPAPVSSPIVSKANGVIYFQVGGGDSETWIDAIRPDGTDLHQVFPPEPVHYDEIAWSPDGSRIAYGDNLVDHFGIYTANPDGSDTHQLTSRANDGWPSWSPDGTKIAFSGSGDSPDAKPCGSGAEAMCAADIYVMNADGTGVSRLTDDPAPEYSPAWSPDGTKIAFVRSDGNGAQDLYVMNADGTGATRLAAGAGTLPHPTWSPDGTKIAFTGFDGTEFGIFVTNADGTGLHELFSKPGWVSEYPVWSPDGTEIAFTKWGAQPSIAGCDSASTCTGQIYLIHPDGTDLTRLTNVPEGGSRPAWQPVPLPASTSLTPSPTTVPTAVSVRVSTVDGVAAFPSAVAVGYGGVWVTSCCQGTDGGSVVRLDPTTGEVVARIGIRAAPGWDFGGAGLATGDGSVWTMGAVGGGSDCCHALVTRIDAATNSVVDEFEVPGITEGDLWIDGEFVYVLGFTAGHGGSEPALRLVKLDATTHAIEWDVEVPGQWSQTVFVAGGSVWVIGTPPNAHGPINPTMLYWISPESGAVQDEIPLGAGSFMPVVYPDTVWFEIGDGVRRFDPTTGTLGPPIQPGPGCCSALFAPDGTGGVWVGSVADVARSIWHLDASGAVVASGTVKDRQAFEEMQGQSYAFDSATQTIWSQHYKDSVARTAITSAARE
jgi:Tol biopolymer transport system component